ncbi:chorismate mutase [Bifidobacterium aemilianum]|uniref:prephenate dehydratase n=1 Tax=Bifidobacterium aemilianum TaxID=2493120 RepID=A0A366K966_9BIFI|nr:prephenate dehydratase domain-containing protein [Bifidobacterium aemilianum]RBP98224.1 chorismate mutase [Bifidobacterium aemilianum]
MRLNYLGPQGTFTHQAAIEASKVMEALSPEAIIAPQPLDTVEEIMTAVQRGKGWGVIAWENNVEGYVVPNLDALIDAKDIAAFARVTINVAFDAFVLDEAQVRNPGGLTQVCAHHHGLAQCRRFTAEHGLEELPATSNAAACRDLMPGQVALGPAICGPLYGLKTLANSVQDFADAHTDFLVLAPRGEVLDVLEDYRRRELGEFETVIAFVLLHTGAGSLSKVLDLMRDAGLNMTSFMSRPVKGHDGAYSFFATVDAAPWQPHFRWVLAQFLSQGEWVKTLAVYPRSERPDPPVDTSMLPHGGVYLGPECADQARNIIKADSGTAPAAPGQLPGLDLATAASQPGQDPRMEGQGEAMRRELLW